MGSSRVYHRLDKAAVARLLTSEQGPVARDLMRRGLRVETRAKANLAGSGGPRRINTGRLRSSVTTTLVRVAGAPAVRVGSDVDYAVLIHNGTGIYGPSGSPIRPRSGRFLVFTPKGSSTVVFARQVRGMEPNPFLTNALAAARG